MTEDSTEERRCAQRILTSQEGRPPFWLLVGQARLALCDLSLEGFAVPGALGLDEGRAFAFSIEWDGEAGSIHGEAEVVNALGGASGQIGCRILALSEDGHERLHRWLAAHVAACAAVPISAEEAAEIVSGPCIV
jgi:hypothetical protein